jgi:hypothetical protein
MTTLYEKITKLPSSLLPKVERFVDLLPLMEDKYNVVGDSDWSLPLFDENGKKVHPKAGCLKGIIVMNDNFFEPDDDWEEYL